MTLRVLSASILLMAGYAAANEVPVVHVLSAAMRPGTTLMDVTYRIDDPDDATVKVRALAFVDGVRSFEKVIRPTTWAENTQTNIGDTITTGVSHTLTWDVAADWDIDLGQLKFEVLCRDSRGLLPLEWITIPAAGGEPEITISRNVPVSQVAYDALLWLYAEGDQGLSLEGGYLRGSPASKGFSGIPLANGSQLTSHASVYLFKKMNLQPASYYEVNYAGQVARAGLTDVDRWHVLRQPYTGVRLVVGWGLDYLDISSQPAGVSDIVSIAAGQEYNLALCSDGRVIGWGYNQNGQATPPAGLTNAVAVAAGAAHSLALCSDGRVVGWGYNQNGQATPPAGLSNVVAIAADGAHSLALRSDGRVVGWGYEEFWCNTPPAGLTNAVAIAAGDRHSLALRSDGSVVGWGYDGFGQATPPAGLTNAVAIAASGNQSLALRSDGSVVEWGCNDYGWGTPPAGLSNVVAVAVGEMYSLALRSDGRVVGWGKDGNGQATPPAGLTNAVAIAAGRVHSLAIIIDEP